MAVWEWLSGEGAEYCDACRKAARNRDDLDCEECEGRCPDLMPDNAETVRATAQLAEEGFVVLPYMFPDLVCARDARHVAEGTGRGNGHPPQRRETS